MKRSIACILFMAFANVCAPNTLAAEKIISLPPLDEGKISARYSVHWGLLRLADMTLHWDVSENAYSIAMTARTRGLIRAVFKAQSELKSAGTRYDKALKPNAFSTQSTFNSKAFAREMVFDASGIASITRAVKPDDFDMKRSPVPAPLKRGPDPLSAFFLASLETGDITKQRSYDGVQVAESTLDCAADTGPLKKSKRNIYLGETQRCTLTGDVIAGDVIEEKDADEEDVDGRDFETVIWFARTADGAMRLPVRINADSQRGTVKIYLREVGAALAP